VKTTITMGKFRDLPSTELTETLSQLRDELFRLRLGMQTNQVASTAQVGAKRRDIAGQFLVETLVLSCGGGLVGLALGYGLAIAMRNAVDIPTIVKPWSLAVAFGVSVLVGLLSGLYPARRAARLDPIEALRHS